MRKWILRCFLLVIVIVVAGVVGGGVWALNSPWVGMKVMSRLIEQPSSGMRVESISIRRQTYSWPGQFRMEGVSLAIERKGKAIRLDSPEVLLDGTATLLSDTKNLTITVTDGDIAYDDITVKGAQARLALHLGSPRWTIEGPVEAASVTWEKWNMADFSSAMTCDSRSIDFANLRADLYGGSVSGTVNVVFGKTAYSADIAAYGIEMAQLAEVSGTLAREIKGSAGGHIRVAGRGNLLDSMETDWTMAKGAEIDAALLSALLQYIPKQSRERKHLDTLIKNGGLLPVEVLKLNLRSNNPRHLGGEITLKSRKVNLELNVTTDINTDGRLSSLLDITSGS